MIINIRGTNGAGKTHLVRRLMERLGPGIDIERIHPVKNRPFVCGREHSGVFFVGRYDVQNGGCDTLRWKGDAEWLTDLIVQTSKDGWHVVFEGLIASKWATGRYLNMNRQTEFHAVLLSTDLDACLDSVNARRAARGVTEPVNPSQLRDKYAEALNKMKNDKWAGLSIHHLSREDAYTFCCERLGL